MSDKGNILSLGNILGRPVVNSSPQPEFDPDIEDTSFILEDEPEPSPVTQTTEPLPDGSAPRPEDNGYMPHRDLAENAVDVFDLLQENGIIFWLKSKMFTPNEAELLKTMDTSGVTIYQDGTEAIIMAKLKKFNAIAEKIPFKPRDREILINAGERYAKTVNLQVTPLQGLLIAVGGVMKSRVSEVIKEL